MLKLISLFLLLLTFYSCQKETTPYDIYWLHLEGAPLRTSFDHWLTPLTEKENTSSFTLHGQKVFLPKAFLEDNRPIEILENWHYIRGIQTSSPHLKEARVEWMDHLIKEEMSASLTAGNERLERIYRHLLPNAQFSKESDQTSEVFDHTWKKISKRPAPQNLSKIFSSWLNKNDDRLHLGLINGIDSDFFFEATGELTPEKDQRMKEFSKDLVDSLRTFVHILKKRKTFHKSIIFITSDRNRLLLPDQNTTLTWEGSALTLISGALKGPFMLGNIRKEHPKYSDIFPGTWGVGLEDWNPKVVQSFMLDLKKPHEYISLKDKKVSSNPWYFISEFQTLTPKLKWGQTF